MSLEASVRMLPIAINSTSVQTVIMKHTYFPEDDYYEMRQEFKCGRNVKKLVRCTNFDNIIEFDDWTMEKKVN
jgi:hypothetical protein